MHRRIFRLLGATKIIIRSKIIPKWSKILKLQGNTKIIIEIICSCKSTGAKEIICTAKSSSFCLLGTTKIIIIISSKVFVKSSKIICSCKFTGVKEIICTVKSSSFWAPPRSSSVSVLIHFPYIFIFYLYFFLMLQLHADLSKIATKGRFLGHMLQLNFSDYTKIV